MAYDCAQRFSALPLVMAWCLSLACGKVTTPGGPGGSITPRDNDEEDDTRDEPSRQPMPDAAAPMNDRPPPGIDDDPAACDDVVVAGLSVTLGSVAFQCDDLSVVVTATDFEENLSCFLLDERCRCFGVHERPGTYRLSVQTGEPPVELAQRQVEVVMDDANCHVETEFVTLRVNAPDDAGARAPDAGGDDNAPDPVDAGS